jgi:hypothetical protein
VVELPAHPSATLSAERDGRHLPQEPNGHLRKASLETNYSHGIESDTETYSLIGCACFREKSHSQR